MDPREDNPLQPPRPEPVPFQWPVGPEDAPALTPLYPGKGRESTEAEETGYDAHLAIVQKVYTEEDPHPATGKSYHVDVIRAFDSREPVVGHVEDGATRGGFTSAVELSEDLDVAEGEALIVLPARPNQIPLAVPPGGGAGIRMGAVVDVDIEGRCVPYVYVNIKRPAGDPELEADADNYENDPAYLDADTGLPRNVLVRILPYWGPVAPAEGAWMHGLSNGQIVPLWRRGKYWFTLDLKLEVGVAPPAEGDVCDDDYAYGSPC
jgi:hypothetical protein